MSKRGQVLGLQRLVEIGQWVEGELQKRSSIRLHYSWPMAFYSLKHLLNLDGHSCNIFNILGILPSGHLAMCGIGIQVPDLCYGLLGEDPIADLWTSNPILADLRQSLPKDLEGVCGKCIFRGQCLGSCVAENYHTYGKLVAPFWFCQEAYAKGFFPLSRLRELTEVLPSREV